MIRVNELNEFTDKDITHELKAFLIRKFSDIVKEYNLSGMGGMFSVILLEENETEYISDKLFEFCEIMNFDNAEYIHTVWASESYSEDIYVPYNKDIFEKIERGCLQNV
ncbi:MAG: hypothetical protein ACI4JM_05480 [Oscillospiraceae bacterium]